MLMKKLALAGMIAGLLLGGSAIAADKASADAAIAAAKAAQKEAAAAGGEWKMIGDLLKDADKAASEGNFASAESLAKKAESYSKPGKEQAMGQSNVGNPGYLYN